MVGCGKAKRPGESWKPPRWRASRRMHRPGVVCGLSSLTITKALICLDGPSPRTLPRSCSSWVWGTRGWYANASSYHKTLCVFVCETGDIEASLWCRNRNLCGRGPRRRRLFSFGLGGGGVKERHPELDVRTARLGPAQHPFLLQRKCASRLC